MEDFLDILKYVIPSLIVFATAYYLIKKMLDNDYKVKLLELRKSTKKEVLPVKLQAYERMVLFLERISPNSILMRLPHTSLNSMQLQANMLKTIRGEFEHNLSQQIYITKGSWEAIKKAKEEIIQLVNICASKVPEDSAATELSQLIIIEYGKMTKTPNQAAMDVLKNEILEAF